MTTDLRIGHVLDRLAEMPSDSVHCVWSSPPYWGLRSYGTEAQEWPTGWAGEHGLEPTLDLWLQHEVLIWREVRRVLRPDGTAWINCGDAYATAPNGRSAADQKAAGTDDRTFRDKPVDTSSVGLASKQRLMLPARLALALQADGWWLRDEIVWSKANPMPSSVKDRTTPAHEMLYLLSKRPRYFFDDTAIAEPIAESSHARYDQESINEQTGGFKQEAYEGSGLVGQRSRSRRPAEILKSLGEGDRTRRKRSVWHMALEPFPGAHFATAPTGIVRPCILAGTSAKGVCPSCGAPWVRETETSLVPTAKACRAGVIDERDLAADPSDQGANRQKDGHVPGMALAHKTLGWSPSCACPPAKPIPATVLDPFGGSGTTAIVAGELGRDAILIELNPDYARIARERIREHLGRVKSEIPDERGVDLPLLAWSPP